MAKFIHNPISYICAECGHVVEIKHGDKDKRFHSKLGTSILVRCHNISCQQAMQWYLIDTEKLMVDGVKDDGENS